MKAWIANERGLELIGQVSPGWTGEAYPGGDAPFPSDPAGVVFWNPAWVISYGGTRPANRCSTW